jgi:hypothetical protein
VPTARFWARQLDTPTLPADSLTHMRSVSLGDRTCPGVYIHVCCLSAPPYRGPSLSHLGLNNKRRLGGFPQLTNAGEYHYNPNWHRNEHHELEVDAETSIHHYQDRPSKQKIKTFATRLQSQQTAAATLRVKISRPVRPSIAPHATCALPTTSQSSSSSDATPDRAVPPPNTHPFVVCTREMLAKAKLNVRRPHEGGSKRCN